MEQRGLTRKDLEAALGSRARVSEMLKRRCPLTMKMAWRLHQVLHPGRRPDPAVRAHPVKDGKGNEHTPGSGRPPQAPERSRLAAGPLEMATEWGFSAGAAPGVAQGPQEMSHEHARPAVRSRRDAGGQRLPARPGVAGGPARRRHRARGLADPPAHRHERRPVRRALLRETGHEVDASDARAAAASCTPRRTGDGSARSGRCPAPASCWRA